MNKCISCGKDFVDPKTSTCKFCGTKKPENAMQETSKEIDKGVDTISETESKSEHKDKIEQSIHPSENMINSVANFILAAGIIALIILLFTIVFVETPVMDYYTRTEFNPAGLATAIATLITSIIVYSVMKVIRIISINTRKTKEYLAEIYNNKMQ